ncbi:YjiH family protein [Pseudoalteromonas sp. Scap03]|jgi:nucleoside recognition membrane protein YjiH|uniref:YjiH family protein n=1 Tax=unclassified Pseudoalteromonas TaxID=194690 RepID=UPI0015BBC9D0|nr:MULTISPECIES: YjiH family protein [unclassified Pseudoalteromonas]MDN3486260.1 YjiH family protein [Pseudoalteromonas sp. APC 3224]NWL16675.1 YjiH family protein [Pseudoalteromonas sp. Scap03]QLE81783.1 YjiH family protein [Pseudoalteromonas sp. Scap25]QLE89727.1 YjiH family protein [Pseudoalteromonas sp. Scap06]
MSQLDSSRPASVQKSYDLKVWLVFLIPSLIGVFLFMTPVPSGEIMTIPIAVMAKAIQASFSEIALGLIATIICITGVMSLVLSVFKPKSLTKFRLLNHLFNVSWIWLVTRLFGMAFVLLTYFQVGPHAITSENTGLLVLKDLLPVLFSVFILAGLLLPLLLNFGLLELVGTLLTKVMRPLFGVPGRSAVNCVASWLGDGSVGILMTARQYEDKYYTQREAAIIGTTFSAVSITFCLVVIGQVKLEYLFAPFYLTVCLAGVVAAIIVPRLPPLRFKKDVLIDGEEPDGNAELVPEGKTLFKHSLDVALTKAEKAPGLKGTLEEGIHNAFDMVFAVLPVVMAVGTFALIIAEYTPIFQYLGMPFIPFLELLQVPEAEMAAQTIMVGFADMFIPSILAAGSIESDVTRFIIAAMSVTQLIYMSEVGALLLGSKIPVNIFELFVIFILRTLVTLPVIALMAHWLVG